MQHRALIRRCVLQPWTRNPQSGFLTPLSSHNLALGKFGRFARI